MEDRLADASIEFWYEFASTYSYPAAMRIEALAAAAGIRVVWRPFLLGPIFAAQGWRDSPFNLYPAKGRYMWRDLARITAALGVPFRQPSRFPRNSLLAARVALVGEGDWIHRFSRAVYVANFGEDREIGDPSALAEILERLSIPAESAIAAAAAPEIKQKLKDNTDAAIAAGIFGAPSFLAREELFWGNDRLEEAIAHAANR